MASDMNLPKLLAISALAVLISGCGLLPRTQPERHAIPTSNHTIQELCDSTRHFFATRAGTENLKISAGAGGKALTDKIDTGNGCFYETGDPSASPSHLGYVSLFRIIVSDNPPLSTPASASENYPTRVITVDGVTVKVATEPMPKGGESATTLLDVYLTASIDGWEGELLFKGTEKETVRDDQTTRAAAQALVNMIRTLKG
ncbi:hypothetical protein [Nocardia altamirensis]|uniref:hypothetical protein n=1 Tax=Nocardia altamirensis TaxID=472158 RepID=UPI00114CD52D|nr:hypothetical protein [Nocardia altamirensis]